MPPPRIADPTHPAQRGLAQLVLAARHGRTRLVQCSTRPPLVVQKALYPDESVPDMAFVYLANPTGGMLGNDLHTVSVEVCSGGKAHITTQNATKIFSMTQGSASQQVNLTVSAGCYLEYLPDPIIPFQASSFEQITSIRISPGGTLLHAEVLTPGRVAMGESFQYQRLASRIVAYGQDEYPFYREAFELTPATRNPMVPAVLGLPFRGSEHPMDSNTLGSMLVFTDPVHLPSLLKASQESLTTHPHVRAGVTTLPDSKGVGVKIIGRDTASVRAAIADVWSVVRKQILGVPAPFLRKY